MIFLAERVDQANTHLYDAHLFRTGSYRSALAQSVEQMTVNHWVAGSSPAGGAKISNKIKWLHFRMWPFFYLSNSCLIEFRKHLQKYSLKSLRAQDCDSCGRGFDPHQPPHYLRGLREFFSLKTPTFRTCFRTSFYFLKIILCFYPTPRLQFTTRP